MQKRVYIVLFLISACFFSSWAATYVSIESAVFNGDGTFTIVSQSDATDQEQVVGQLRFIDQNGMEQFSELLPFTLLNFDAPSSLSTWALTFISPDSQGSVDYRVCNLLQGEVENCTEFVSSVVPVRLGSFEAFDDGNQVRLQWSTLFECFASHFEIERKLEGSNFSVIDTIPTEGGGVACIGADYIYIDEISPSDIQAEKITYRLKMYDIDDSFFFSVPLGIDANSNLIFFYAYETNSFIVQNFDENAVLEIYDLTGRLLFKGVLNNSQPVMATSSRGLHIARVSDGTNTKTITFFAP